MRRLAHILLAAAMLGGGALRAQPAPIEPAPTVDFELREEGRLVAMPSVTVELGRPAAISIGTYSLRLRVTRAPGAEGPAPYLVRSSLDRSAGGWNLVASPAVTVIAGEQAELRFADAEGRELSLAVLVR